MFSVTNEQITAKNPSDIKLQVRQCYKLTDLER